MRDTSDEIPLRLMAMPETRGIASLLVDTGSEYTWVREAKLQKIRVTREKKDLQFVMANGTVVTRSVGFAILRVG
jgi:hypothetical protein